MRKVRSIFFIVPTAQDKAAKRAVGANLHKLCSKVIYLLTQSYIPIRQKVYKYAKEVWEVSFPDCLEISYSYDKIL